MWCGVQNKSAAREAPPDGASAAKEAQAVTSERAALIVEAAKNADWVQVVLNGGPPCFHLEEDRSRFCLRAERWDGHGAADHPFVSLADLFSADATALAQAEQLAAARWEWEIVERLMRQHNEWKAKAEKAEAALAKAEQEQDWAYERLRDAACAPGVGESFRDCIEQSAQIIERARAAEAEASACRADLVAARTELRDYELAYGRFLRPEE